MLYSERVADGAVEDLLPINALRNAATLPVRTGFIAMLDVDLLPSRAFLPSFNARQGRRAEARIIADHHATGQLMLMLRSNVHLRCLLVRSQVGRV